jgi:hypothetical protein
MIFGVLQFRKGLNGIKLQTGDVVAAPERARQCPALPHVVPSNLWRTNVPMPPLWTRARPWGLHLAFPHTLRAGGLQLHAQATRRTAAATTSRWLRVHARPSRQGAELRQARRRFPRCPRDLAPGSPRARRTGSLQSRASHDRRPVPHLHGRHLDAPPSKATVSPSPHTVPSIHQSFYRRPFVLMPRRRRTVGVAAGAPERLRRRRPARPPPVRPTIKTEPQVNLHHFPTFSRPSPAFSSPDFGPLRRPVRPGTTLRLPCSFQGDFRNPGTFV